MYARRSRFVRGVGTPLLVAALLLPPAAHAALVKAVEYVGDHVFLTANPAEIAALDSGRIVGWTRTGLELWVHDAPGPGLVPVCRFYSDRFAPSGLHFLTGFDGECEALKDGTMWIDEGVAFYAALPTAPIGEVPMCSAGTFPIYRWYNNGQGGVPRHAFTPYARNLSVEGGGLGGYAENGWVSEGLGYVGWAPVNTDDWWGEWYWQDGIAFCAVAQSAAARFDFDAAAAGSLALVVGTRWTLQSADGSAIPLEFANEIIQQTGYRFLRVSAGDRTGTASWIGSNGQLGITLAPPLGVLNATFHSLYLTFVGRNLIEGCVYQQRLPWLGAGFEPCERVVGTRH